jgi:hypothetical protein
MRLAVPRPSLKLSPWNGQKQIDSGIQSLLDCAKTATLEAYSKSKSDRTEAIGADHFIRLAREIGQRRVLGVVFASCSLNETSWEELPCQLQ